MCLYQAHANITMLLGDSSVTIVIYGLLVYGHDFLYIIILNLEIFATHTKNTSTLEPLP